ncbi:protein kinase-like protein [Leptomonas pyrrhocoris]|uniref:Protein kinase-like protein n=1 Tax=Leptomonas pyrrhocoris TaxID=157538 RepID=A0A0N0VFT9_LEPPY|nr:protein kinase-like protein [Leptomonas pyrrhocoris]KPA81474.1 protein kinase-like protein [Leptomonas pyrrhocoris]|eukprot:XP_015659913.1 protein kinase-like protein [Leptomonas pyrrhocoris]
MKSYRIPASYQKGRYVPSKVLGTGTYGQVIRCYDTMTGKEVAVKVAQSDAAYRRSALNEISALVALKENHDSVNILDSFEDDGHVCIVSELLDRNLFEVLRNRGFGPLSLSEVRQVAKHVLGALAALHNTGFIHCDIKPENIMLRCHESTSSDNSPALHPFNGDGFNNSGCSNRSGELPSNTHTFAPGQEMMMVDSNSNLNNQLWRNSSAIDAAAGSSHSAAFFESELNFGFSQRYGPKTMGRSSNGNAARNGSSSFDALFGTSPTSNNNNSSSNGMRNDSRVERNFPAPSEEEAERRRSSIAFSPYCRTCLIDFGAVRRFHENTYYDVQSLWYRAPEVLCGLPYTTAIDSWSVGCVLFELFTGKPFFPGENPQQQLSLIVQHVGYPSQTALSMGCLACQYNLPMLHVTAESRREHVRQWVRSWREAGLQRWRKHQLQKQQDAIPPLRNPRSRYTADSSSSTDDDDAVANGNPFDESDVDGTSEERELLIDLICELLNPDETQRLSCTQAQQHPFLSALQCCNATPCPFTATPVVCLGTQSAMPQQVPCVMASMPMAHPVMMAASPVSLQMGCSPVSPFMLHTAAGSTVPYTASQMDSMAPGLDMNSSSVGMAPHQQPPPAFGAYANAHNPAIFAAAAPVMAHALPMYTPIAHVSNDNSAQTCMPLGLSSSSTGVYNSPASTGSLPQPTAVSMSPSFSSPTAFSQVHVPLGFSPVAMPGMSGGNEMSSMQSLGAPSYMLATNGAMPYVSGYHTDTAPGGMSSYVLCHFQQHPSCATVISP